MKHKILLNLLALSTLTGSMLTMLLTAKLTNATTAIAPIQASCSAWIEPGAEPGMAVESEITLSELNSATPIAMRIDASTEAANPEAVNNESPMMDFTAAESDAAVALFGCDCPPCINALRQLQSQSLSQVLLSSSQSSSQPRDQVAVSNSQGHCWTTLQQRVSPEEAQSILQQLDAEEPN